MKGTKARLPPQPHYNSEESVHTKIEISMGDPPCLCFVYMLVN